MEGNGSPDIEIPKNEVARPTTHEQWTVDLKLKDGAPMNATFQSEKVDKNQPRWQQIEQKLKLFPDSINPDKLLAEDWANCEVAASAGRHISIVFPETAFPDELSKKQYMESIAKINFEMERKLKTEEFGGEIVTYYLIPQDTLPRAFAAANDIFIQPTESFETYAHEKTHVEMNIQHGFSFVPSLNEGAALYFAHDRFPKGKINNPLQQVQIESVLQAICEAKALNSEIPLTFLDKEVQEKMVWDDRITHEFIYPLGATFTNYFITSRGEHGEEDFLKLYQLTSERIGNLENPVTQEKVIVDEKPVASAEKILEAALLTMGIPVVGVSWGLRQYIEEKNRELTQAKQTSVQ